MAPRVPETLGSLAHHAGPGGLSPLWTRLDAIVADVRPTWWGAVVIDPSRPDVWDLNYARVDVPEPVSLADVEASLLPPLRAADVAVEHVVSFAHEVHGDLFAALTDRGHRVGWTR